MSERERERESVCERDGENQRERDRERERERDVDKSREKTDERASEREKEREGGERERPCLLTPCPKPPSRRGPLRGRSHIPTPGKTRSDTPARRISSLSSVVRIARVNRSSLCETPVGASRGVHRVSSSLLGPVDPSFPALS